MPLCDNLPSQSYQWALGLLMFHLYHQRQDPDPHDAYAPPYVYYVRSGYTGTQAWTWNHWTGAYSLVCWFVCLCPVSLVVLYGGPIVLFVCVGACPCASNFALLLHFWLGGGG